MYEYIIYLFGKNKSSKEWGKEFSDTKCILVGILNRTEFDFHGNFFKRTKKLQKIVIINSNEHRIHTESFFD